MGNYYQAASEICDSLEARSSRSPEWLYARASLLYGRMVDRADSIGRAEFWDVTDACIDTINRRLKLDHGDQISAHFLRAASLSIQGLQFHQEGAKVAGLRKLMKSRGDFDRCIRADSSFYDAYLGRGAYRYGMASHAGLVGWLPFMPNKEDGWKDLWIAVEKSSFSKWSALSAMVWFVLDEENFILADSICSAGLARFPESRTFLWPKLSLEIRQKNWPIAYETATKLLHQYDELATSNGYKQIGLCYQLMEISDSMERPAEALKWAQRGIEIKCSPDVAERRANKLADFKQKLSQKK